MHAEISCNIYKQGFQLHLEANNKKTEFSQRLTEVGQSRSQHELDAKLSNFCYYLE